MFRAARPIPKVLAATVFVVIVSSLIAVVQAEHGDCCLFLSLGFQGGWNFAPLLLDIETGAFRKENFEVKGTEFKSATEIVAQLETGDLAVGAITVTAESLGALAGKRNLRVVADGGQSRSGSAIRSLIMVRADLAGIIKDLRSLKGRTVGVLDRQGMDFYGFILQIERAGLKEADLRLVLFTSGVAAADALGTRAVDAAVVSEPFAGFLRAKQAAVILKQTDSPSLQTGLLLYSTKASFWKNRRAGRHFALAYLNGLRSFRDRPLSADAAKILQTYTGFEPDAILSATKAYYARDGKPNVQSIDNFQKWLVQEGFLRQVSSIATITDFSFLTR